MFCTECICHSCPYGLKCYVCNAWLDGHIIISEGCSGFRKSTECPLDTMTRQYSKPEHAEELRKMIRAKDTDAMKAFFDPKTGPWHKKER